MYKLQITLVLTVVICLMVSGCGASKKVERVDVETTIYLSGRWNDADSRMVSQATVTDLDQEGGREAYSTKWI